MLSSSDQTTAMFFKNKIFTHKVSEKTLFSVFFSFWGTITLNAISRLLI